jgi:hypothetical protein
MASPEACKFVGNPSILPEVAETEQLGGVICEFYTLL